MDAIMAHAAILALAVVLCLELYNALNEGPDDFA